MLTRSGAEWMPNFIELLQRKLSRIDDPVLQKMVATSLIGGLTSLFIAYLNGRLGATRKQFIDYCVGMLMSTHLCSQPAAAAARSRPDRWPAAPRRNLMLLGVHRYIDCYP